MPVGESATRNEVAPPQAEEEVERRYVHRALQQLGGDKRELAHRLGVSKRTLYRKLG